MTFAEAMANETTLGLEVIKSGETRRRGRRGSPREPAATASSDAARQPARRPNGA